MTPALRLAAGAGAGIVAMSATYPLDMVRGRLTIQVSHRVQHARLPPVLISHAVSVSVMND